MFDNDVRVVGRSGVDAGIARTRGCSRRRTATSGDDESQCRAGPNEAIAHVVSSRRSTTPNAPLKADRQEASVPLRADGSPVWAFRSPGLRIAAPSPPSRGLHLSGVCWTRAPRSQLRDSSGISPDSLGTQWESYRGFRPTQKPAKRRVL